MSTYAVDQENRNGTDAYFEYVVRETEANRKEDGWMGQWARVE